MYNQGKKGLKMRHFSSRYARLEFACGRYDSRPSYRPIGSDDGYDYHKDNRNGEVDDYVKFVEEWRKNQNKDNTPQ